MFRAAPAVFGPDGQSLNISPTMVDNWPVRLCNGIGLPAPLNFHVGGGFNATRLAYAPIWVRPYANAGVITMYSLCGGTTDIQQNRTGAQVYESMVFMADQAKSWGYDLVIATTITPSYVFGGPQNTERLDANSRIMADADGAFDGSIDLVVAGLDDYTNATYYSDGLHYTAAGAQLAADTITPTVVSLLAA